MAEFFEGDDLSIKIKYLMKGKNVRCAVAFWGNGSEELFVDSLTSLKNSKIVCDISMGCTSDKALRKLNAPLNKNLRHHNNFHSKIYISDRGAIIASANASSNGIGLCNLHRKLEEAGVFLDPILDKNAYKSSESTFEKYFDNASKVDEFAISSAKKKWKANQMNKNLQYGEALKFDGSILSLLRTNPELFLGIGFVIYDTPINIAVKDAAQVMALDIWENETTIASIAAERPKKTSLDVFSFEFDEGISRDLPNDPFPSLFVSFYVTRTKLHTGFFERIVPTFKMEDPENVSNPYYYVAVSKKLTWMDLKKKLAKAAKFKDKSDLKLKKEIVQITDFKSIKRLSEQSKYIFADANSFAEYIVETF